MNRQNKSISGALHLPADPGRFDYLRPRVVQAIARPEIVNLSTIRR